MITHSSIAQYICPHCGKKYKHRGTLQRHVVLHKADQRHTCKICNKKFDRKAYLIEHFEIHIGKESCSHCNKSVYHLSQHLKECSKAVPRQTTYVCDVCSKKFSMRRYLKEHKKCAHDKKEQYECDKCGNKYSFRGSLFHHTKKCQANN